MKRELVALSRLSVRDDFRRLSKAYADCFEQLRLSHAQNKQARDRWRVFCRDVLQGDDLVAALRALDSESQQDGLARRRLKEDRERVLAPLSQEVAKADRAMRQMKQQYKEISDCWQRKILPAYAVARRRDGLCEALSILYRDEFLIVVDKPAGLLSVPGRRIHLQDSVLSRLRCQLPTYSFLQVVHRLDRDTSGVLAIAASASAHKLLSEQFARHQVQKTYEAILSGPVNRSAGSIELPLWGNPQQRPKQVVDFRYGKPSRTDFWVIEGGEWPRIELRPLTGRTHQLRVHMACGKGLMSPILGDALYGAAAEGSRLHLHAARLSLVHPVTNEALHFCSEPPF
ncbi:MAG: RluA family pseudouridine synthase [Cyanobacteria bacterium J06623_4]